MSGELPYPVISLLPDFDRPEAAHYFFGHDPHWNRHGAALAAGAVLRELRARGLLPCP